MAEPHPTPYFREAGAGPGVVCLHANASSSSQWRPLMEALAPRFCVLAPDSYGAGRSPAWPTDRPVRLRDGAVRLPDGTLAGSVLTMDEAIRNLVASGAGWTDAVHAASTAPARLVGRDDLGRLAPGMPAHLTVLDDDLSVLRTLVSGREAAALARPASWSA